MAYEKQVWTDLAGQGLNKYTDQEGNVLTLSWSPDSVTQAGSAYNAQRMNHIEDGIYNHNPIVETVALPASWTLGNDVYTNTVSVAGVLASDTPFISCDIDNVNQQTAWNDIYKAVCSNGAITFYSFTNIAVALNVQVVIIR